MEPITQSIFSSGASSVLNMAASALANYQSKQYSKELMDYQNDINVANWEREMQYNTPSAQMQRYKDAGLNPNLIYGQGSSGTTSAPSVSQSNFKAQKLLEGNEVIQQFYATRNLLKDIELKDAELGLKHEQKRNLTLQGNRYSAEASIANARAQMKAQELNALYTYICDKSKTALPEYLEGEAAEQARHNPFYYSYQNANISVNAAEQRLRNLTAQGTILEYQAHNMSATDALFNGNINSTGDLLRAVLQLLTGGILFNKF